MVINSIESISRWRIYEYLWLEGEDKETREYKSDDDDRAFCFASRVG